MSKLKGYPLPSGAIDGYPLICVRMMIPDEPQYRRDFFGHMWLLGKWWSWEHGTPGDTRAKTAGEYWRDLLFDHLVIEECPVDCCDDILAAIAALKTAFLDQSALNLNAQLTAGDLESQRLRDELAEMYDGDPTSINPNAPTTDFGATGDRYDALCAGLTAFVYGFARVQAEHVRLAEIGSLVALGLIAALLIPGLGFFLVVGASIAVSLGSAIVGVTTETAIAALTDQVALGNVICCMRDALKDQAVSEANWLTALSGCGFAGGSHEQIISDFIAPTLAANYLTILNILGQAYTGVIDGEQLPECPDCGEPPPPVGCEDLELSQETWYPVSGWGEWIDGEGLAPKDLGGTLVFRWNRPTEGVARTIDRFKIVLNEPVAGITISTGTGSYTHPTTVSEFEIGAAEAPAILPYDTIASGQIGIYLGAYVVSSLSYRVQMFCLLED